MTDGIELQLSNGGVALIDAADLERVMARGSWYWLDDRNTRYVRHTNPKDPVRLHRFIMDCPKGMVVDHLNGNGLDNRRCNLRVVTQGENVRNVVAIRKDNTSGFRGVYQIKRNGKWRAILRHKRKDIIFGDFENIEDAIRARVEGERRIWSPEDLYRTNLERGDSAMLAALTEGK